MTDVKLLSIAVSVWSICLIKGEYLNWLANKPKFETPYWYIVFVIEFFIDSAEIVVFVESYLIDIQFQL